MIQIFIKNKDNGKDRSDDIDNPINLYNIEDMESRNKIFR
jgi:hypothetical protein